MRQEVYKAIDSERDYQEAQTANPERPDMIEDFHAGDGLSAIQYNLDKAREAWYKGATPYSEMMNYLRKVAGICVKMGENYGMQGRDGVNYRSPSISRQNTFSKDIKTI